VRRTPGSRNTFPLVPRYRVSGLPLGGRPSQRRGHGSDVAGSRAYVRGDPVSTIDWRASARLSTAHSRDEFVVRERYAEEAPRVVVVRDRRPAMRLYEPPFPWLSKSAAVRAVISAIAASADAVNSPLAYLDVAGGDEPAYWIPPQGRGVLARIEDRDRTGGNHGPPDSLARSFEFLARARGELFSGTFVFVISDFLGTPVPNAVWLAAAARRWEVVPVVVQDTTWEQSFPVVPSVILPLLDPASGEIVDVRLSRREANERRQANEDRSAALLAGFRSLGVEPVLIGTSEPDEIVFLFLEWASRRRQIAARR
jgi:uncharacterized protein (DUF58 family)